MADYKRQQEIIEQVKKGNYESSLQKRMKKRNANLRKQQAEADIAPVKDDKNFLQKIVKGSNAFDNVLAPLDDGFNLTDIPKIGLNTVGATAKTVASTGADIALNILKAPVQVGTDAGKLVAGGVAQVADWAGKDDYAEMVRKRIAGKKELAFDFKPLEKLDKAIDKVDENSIIGDTGDKIAYGAGYLGTLGATGKVAGSVAGKLGKGADAVKKATEVARDVTMFSSSAGGELGESYQKEGVEDWQAWTKAIGSGLLTTQIEKIGGVFGKGKGWDTKVADAITKGMGSAGGKLATRMGMSGLAEAGEEFLEYAFNQVLDLSIDTVNSATSKNEATFLEEWNNEEVWESMFIGFVLGSGAKGVQYAGETSEIKSAGNMNTKDALGVLATREDARTIAEDIEILNKQLEESTDVNKSLQLQEQIKQKEQELIEVQTSSESQKVAEQKAQIEEKVAEQEATADPRAKEIIQDEIDIMQEEKTEAEQRLEQVNQKINEDKQAEIKETEAKAKKVQQRIDKVSKKMQPLEKKLVAENTNQNVEKLESLRKTREAYKDNAIVRQAIDEQIYKIEHDTRVEENPAPATQESAEQEATKSLQNKTDADVVESNENIPFSRDVGITDSNVDVETKIKETFGLKNNETKELYTKIASVDSVEQVREVLEDYKDINETVKDDRVKEIKKAIKNTKLDVNQVKKEITDYNDFRKANFGNLRLGNDGMAIDNFYQELAESYPDYFDSNVTNVADQLEAISDFAKLSKAEYTQKVGEIGENDLQKLSEELYAEVHAKEFNNDANYKNSLKDLDKVVEQEEVRQQEMEAIKEQVTAFKDELKSLRKIKKEFEDTIKTLKNELTLEKNGKNDIINTNNDESQGGYSNEFTTLQRESKNLSSDELSSYRDGSKRVDEGFKRRLRAVLRKEINRSRDSQHLNESTLLNSKTNTELNIVEEVDGQLFHDTFEIVRQYLKNGELVDIHGVQTTEDGIGYNDTKNYLSEDGLSGFAITPDGDLISVFNLGERGYLKTIKDYIAEKGAKTLDCYNSPNQPLTAMYETQLGFKAVSTMDYNMEYDHDNIAQNHLYPQIAFMVRTDQDVEVKHFNKDQYDEAVEYRNEIMKQLENSYQGSFSFELTDDQKAKIEELRADTKHWTETYKRMYPNDTAYANKRIKGVAMENSALMRDITQGDLLIPIEGGLTEGELRAKINRLKTNYAGKEVIVEGEQGKIIGNSFGKIGVEFADGTVKYVEKNLVQPAQDIDALIQAQKEAYKQYKQTPSEIDETAPISKKELTVDKSVAPAQKVAKNKNTKLIDSLEEAEQEEYEKIAQVMTERPTPQNRDQRTIMKARASFLDKGSVFEDLSLKTRNRELMAKWDNLMLAQAKAQHTIHSGVQRSNTDTKAIEQASKSLDSMREKVVNSGKIQEFSDYMYHYLNVDRMSLASNAQTKMAELQANELKDFTPEEIAKLSRKRITDKVDDATADLIDKAKEYMNLSEVKNKPVFGDSVTAEQSRQMVEELEFNNPEFAEWANEIYEYNRALRDILVENGVISQETSDYFEAIYPHYVPIQRIDVNGKAVNVPLDTNRTGINTPIKRATGGNSDIMPLFDTLASRTLQTYRASSRNSFGLELKKALRSNSVSETASVESVMDSVDDQESLLQEGTNGYAPTFTVFEDGKKVTYEITQDMYDALKPVSDSSFLSTTIKPLNAWSNFKRGVLTQYNPLFSLTNAIKDVQDVLINSQHPAKTYAKFGEAYAQLLNKGYWYQEYMANGGEQNSYFDSQDGFDHKVKGIERVTELFPLKAISKMNDFVETAPRLAEYIASREAGRSIEVSMLDASRVTTNFKAGGDVTKWANRNGFTFLNASIQGLNQNIRNVREAHAQGVRGYLNLATKFAVAGLPALLLNGMLWDDDEDYEELADYVKQNYYVVAKTEDGDFIRIPKGRMTAVLQESANQMINLITGNDETDLKSYLKLVSDNLAPNNPVTNNVLAPFVQVANNTAWHGGDIVSSSLQDLPAEEQYDESTDKFSIWLGQQIGISPKKINYLLDQNLGGIGDILLPMGTPKAESSTENKILAPFVNKFTTNSTLNNQNITDFYDTSEELLAKSNSSMATDEDVLKNKYINSIKGEMNEFYKQKREVQADESIPEAEKYERVKEIQDQINQLAKEGLDNYENIDKSDTYAQIGDREYYKYTNKEGEEEWRKVEPEELAEINDLGMNLNSKTTYFNLKNRINKIVSADKEVISSEDKRAEVATMVKDSNLTDEQKAYLYGKSYSDDDTLNMVIKSGISFNEYLDYASQTFESDKYSNGKTVSGSKKAKVISYINSLNLSIPQKAILIRKSYPAFREYNNDIVSYVNDLDLSIDEKKTILEELKMTVKSDGTVTWE